jgi:hypothetical protein
MTSSPCALYWDWAQLHQRWWLPAAQPSDCRSVIFTTELILNGLFIWEVVSCCWNLSNVLTCRAESKHARDLVAFPIQTCVRGHVPQPTEINVDPPIKPAWISRAYRPSAVMMYSLTRVHRGLNRDSQWADASSARVNKFMSPWTNRSWHRAIYFSHTSSRASEHKSSMSLLCDA